MEHYIGLYLMTGFVTAAFVRFMMQFDEHEHKTAAIWLALFLSFVDWPVFWLILIAVSMGEIVRNVRSNLAQGHD